MEKNASSYLFRLGLPHIHENYILQAISYNLSNGQSNYYCLKKIHYWIRRNAHILRLFVSSKLSNPILFSIIFMCTFKKKICTWVYEENESFWSPGGWLCSEKILKKPSSPGLDFLFLEVSLLLLAYIYIPHPTSSKLDDGAVLRSFVVGMEKLC